MRDMIEAMALGLIQGITEFLPISSSAHLLLGQYFFGMDQNRFGLAFDMALHLGTLLAVTLFYRTELWNMVRALSPTFSGTGRTGRTNSPGRAGGARGSSAADSDRRLAYLLVLATLPAATIGFLFKSFFEDTLRSPWVVAAGFVFSGVLFLAAEGVGGKRRGADSLTFWKAGFVGVGQAVSLLYGVSRSGATIAFGIFAGLQRTEAARFSFLLSIPITAGAIASELPEVAGAGLAEGTGAAYLIGLVSSAMTAYLSIKLLLAFFARYSLRPFAYYLILAAALIAGALLLGL